MPFLQNTSLKKYPFIRLLAPLIAGIILQWYLQFSFTAVIVCAAIALALFILFQFLSSAKKYVWRWVQGFLIMFFFIATGCIITYTKDIRHQPQWFGKYYQPGNTMLVTLEEPLVEKDKSYKALASVNAVKINNEWKNTTGEILVYFKKDSAGPSLGYGSQLLLDKGLQPITNSGNPGAFDYMRYCLFHNITSQVFLKQDEYTVAAGKNINWLQQQLFSIRTAAINTLQKNIPGRKELGLAEALLIGYQNDLDRELVQAYSNTGVVHIIAISGLHLGMIYGLMLGIFSFFKRQRWSKWVKPIVILFVLWAFTLVAGAVPSILRSAVMFTFIIIGESLGRKTNMYNTLAASAFCMLVYNPFFLWDVGFLLSYAAVISIVTFMRPIYNRIYFQNKILEAIWGLTAVTLAAQVLTIPVILFYFHQLPTLFLVTNFVAVPLSGIILYGELILLCVSFLGGIAKWAGIAVAFLIRMMNGFVENMNALPFSLWDNLKVSVTQTVLLYGFTIAVCVWLMKKSTKAFVGSLICLAAFFISLSVDIIQHSTQQKLVVYNMPKQSAVDIIQGNKYAFTGDSIVQQDNFLRNFHLKPCRTLYRAAQEENFSTVSAANKCIEINNKKILFLNTPLQYYPANDKINVDIIILSKNPSISINQLQHAFQFKELVFDSSNPLWKIEQWKKGCDSLHLRFHSVTQQGAFVMDL